LIERETTQRLTRIVEESGVVVHIIGTPLIRPTPSGTAPATDRPSPLEQLHHPVDLDAPDEPLEVLRERCRADVERIGGSDLRDAVEERMAAGCERFHLVVPVPSGPPPAVAVGFATAEVVMITDVDLPDQREVAAERLEHGLAWLRERGCTADGAIATGDAVDSVRTVVEAGGVVEIIVSTLPSRLSRWLRQDLPSRIARAVDTPLTVVTPADDDE